MRYVTFHKSASKLGPIYIYILCVLLETAGQTKGVLIAAYTLEPRDKYKSTTYSTAKGSPVAWYSGRVFALTKKKTMGFSTGLKLTSALILVLTIVDLAQGSHHQRRK